MEWKTYFTDGLVQIAILLSLSRTDWNNYLNSSLYDGYPEIQEIIMGPLSGYTQTYIHANEWHSGSISMSHPKSISLDYPSSVFHDIHSLGRHWQLGEVNTNIDAFLVSESPPCRLGSEHAQTSQGHLASEVNAANANDDTQQSDSSNQSHSADPHSPLVEGAVGPEADETRSFSFGFPVSNLTKEDMDLIEVLWRQDIDLGIDRDAFDTSRRLELEKQREVELIQQREKEKELEKHRQEHLSKDNLNVTFILDRETGELVPAPEDQISSLPVDSFVPFTHVQLQQDQPQQQADVVLPQQPVLQPESLPQQPVLQPESLPQQPVLQPVLPQPEQQQQQLSFEDGLHILEERVQNFNLPNEEVPLGHDLISQLAEVTDMAREVTEVSDTQTVQPALERQVSFDEHWQELTNILPLDSEIENVDEMMAELATLLDDNNDNNNNNSSDSSNNKTNTDSLAAESLMNNATLSNTVPQMNIQELSFSEDGAMIQPASQEPTEPLHLVSADVLGLSNESAPAGTTFVNSTASLLQHLLRDDIALDLNELSLNGGDAAMEIDDASDSAVSAGGTTSDGESSDVQSNLSSPYDILEGATGGSEVDGARSCDPTETKHMEDPDYIYSKMSFGNEELHLNHSDGSNTSLSATECEADPRKVSHNHTYPLQPGQTPKERRAPKLLKEDLAVRDAQYTRDEKRAKAMHIPLTMDEIISSPVEHFNELLQNHELTDAQLQLIRDIRRRGKNKVAAQNCRKRKMEVLQTLEEEVERMRQERDRLRMQRRSLDKEMATMRHKYSALRDDVLRGLVDDEGHPYDPSQYTLQQNDDGELFLIPHNATLCIKNEPKTKGTRKRKHDRKGR